MTYTLKGKEYLLSLKWEDWLYLKHNYNINTERELILHNRSLNIPLLQEINEINSGLSFEEICNQFPAKSK